MEDRSFKNYQVVSLIHAGSKNIVFKATRNSDKSRVIIKTTKSLYPLPDEIATFQREFQLLLNLDHPDIPKILEFIQDQNNCALVFEDINGITLSDYINKSPMDVSTFLKISNNLAEVVDYLHRNDIIHKDINPGNIIINEDYKIQLIDFSISSKIQSLELTNSIKNLQGTLGYLAPEQTGRLNRMIDSRSDLYALGITFYEMLTGTLPFKAEDPLDLIYAHLALTPPNLNVFNPTIPITLASIVDKLLAKAPEDRYQTAAGLFYDLNQCLSEKSESGDIQPFTLGKKDIPSHIQFPSKLYGRDRELQILNDVIQKSTIGTQVVLVSGSSGTGKSVLIKETLSSMLQKRCLFMEGKFELLKHNMPYFAFKQGLKKFIREILFDTPQEIEKMKQSILSAVGSQGQVLIELVPEMELILGKQPPIDLLPPKETYNRFIGILKEFLKIIATQEHPLVMFMDDLQWADLGSYSLIESVITKTPYCVFIGAYRSNEVKSPHPLIDTIYRVKESYVPVLELELEPLKHQDVEDFIKDIFNTPKIATLTDLLISKTLGNPFFLKELLRFLNEEKLISFNSQKWGWTWDIEEIKKQNISENVVELLIQKMQALPPSTSTPLSVAAALGRNFELKTLAHILKKSEKELLSDLSEAVKGGFLFYSKQSQKEILLIEQGFKSEEAINIQFSHDRIQQAAYELFDKKDRPAIHLKIARSGELSLDNLVFHFNKSIELLTDPQERRKLLNWNIELGKKAKDATAYESALNYLTIAEDLVRRNHIKWEEEQTLLFDLWKEIGECNFLLLHFEEAEKIFNDLLERSKTREGKVEIYCLKTKLYVHLDRNIEAVEEARKGLALYKVHFPKEVKKFHIGLEYLRLKAFSLFKNMKNLQPMKDPDALAIIDLLHAMFPASYQIDPFLYGYVGMKFMWIVSRHGYPPYLLGFFTFIAVLLSRRDFKSAAFYTELTCALNEKLGQAKDWADVETSLGLFAMHWFYPFSKSSQFIKEGTTLSLETGNYLFTGAGLMGNVLCFLRTGAPLEKVQQMSSELCDFLKQHHKPAHLETAIVHNKITLALLGLEELDLAFIEQNLKVIEGVKNIAVHRLILGSLGFYYYIMEDYERSIQYAEEALNLRILVPNSLAMDFHDMFAFLALAKRNVYSKAMEMLEEDARQWAQQNRDNFLGFYLLMLAEKNRISNRPLEALDYYEKAINFFTSQGVVYFTAITSELLANFYADTNRPLISKFYLKEAHYYYLIWGAKLKVDLLEENHPELIDIAKGTVATRTKTKTTTTTSTPGHSSSIVDYLSLLKGLQAISQEIVLENLISTIMQAMMENAGSQRMTLIIEQKDSLIVMAESVLIENKPHTRMVEIPLGQFENLPKSLISYVQKTHEQVLVNFQDDSFVDEYFEKSKIKAALCLPIKQRGKNMGVIYLEHSSSAHAFNLDNLQPLLLLTSQAAISLENAQIYSICKRFVPHAFLEHLNRRNLADVSLGDHTECNMSILFADIRGFTAMSEMMRSEDVFKMINQFLGKCSPIIRKYGGFVDKYIGDAIMALFDVSPDYTLRAAWEIKKAIRDLNEILKAQSLPPIEIGIGINTGVVTLGIIGEEQRVESSVLGDSVNIASRIESYNKQHDTTILISQETMNQLKHPKDFAFRPIDKVQLPGKQHTIEIWELVDCVYLSKD